MTLRRRPSSGHNKGDHWVRRNRNPDEAVRQLQVIRALHGETAYAQVKAGWTLLANDKYPQLKTLQLP